MDSSSAHFNPGDGAAQVNQDVTDPAHAAALLASVLAELRDRLGSTLSNDDLLSLARSTVARIHPPTVISWEDAEPLPLRQVRRREMLDRVVRIVGYAAELPEPRLLSFADDAGVEDAATRVKITDLAGDSMWSLEVVGSALIGKLEATRGEMAEFLCLVVALPVGVQRDRRPALAVEERPREFFVHLVDARLLTDTSAFDLLTASAAERTAAKSLVAEFRARGVTPRRYLRDEVIRSLGIVGTTEVPLLLDLLDFVVLQALSIGRVGSTCARLHVLIVGPPAAGKKLIGLAARALNPVSVELSPAKVSAAGLVGASSQKEGVWRSSPGALPRAHGGVATLQDANFWRSKQLHEVGAVLLEVIEDGVVRSAVAGATTPHQAHTALLLDMNRDRQAWGSGPRSQAPLLALKPLLSRLDLIVALERDDENAIAVAAQIAATVARAPGTDPTWARTLQLLVAALREEHPSIDLEPVGECLGEAVRSLCSRAAEAHLEVGDFAARFAVSLHRLTAAIARSEDRALAEPRDVEEARRFLEIKIDALESPGCEPVPGAINLDSWLERFRGQEVSPADLREAYTQETGHSVDERTVRRHILSRAHAHVGKGKYKLL